MKIYDSDKPIKKELKKERWSWESWLVKPKKLKCHWSIDTQDLYYTDLDVEAILIDALANEIKREEMGEDA